jgi:hypothetical protein
MNTQTASAEIDHVAMLMDNVESAADANAKAVKSTMLSPRFYTTDFKAMDALDVSSVRADWDVMMKEYEGDNNHDHFQRDAAFAEEVRTLMPQLSPEMRQEFLDFLISSLTSEFSGCILYNEIRKNVSNPDIKQLMTYMARDESRHAGFINQSLKDFNLGIDLGSLKLNKAYTYFKPKYIFYATYLSEKIGYARYITIFRQLEKIRTSASTPSFAGSSAGATTNSATANRSRSSCVRSPVCCRAATSSGSAFSSSRYTPPCTCATTRARCCTRPWVWSPPPTTTRSSASPTTSAARCSRSRWTSTTRRSAVVWSGSCRFR